MALRGDDPGMRRATAQLADRGRQRDLLWALGFDGTVAAIEQCLAVIDDPAQAGLAVESFCLITGLAPRGAGSAAHTSEAEDAEEAEPTPRAPELGLPLPDVEAVRSLWRQHRGRFQQNERYLLGMPHGRDALLHGLAAAPMWRRPVLALALAMRTGGVCQLRIELLARDQQQDLARFLELPETSYSSSPGDVWRFLVVEGGEEKPARLSSIA